MLQTPSKPLLISPKTGVIVDHARLEATRRLGMKEVPCITLDGLTDAQIRAYVIADNKLALNAGWNEDLLREELLELKSMEFDMNLLGFDPEEMADIALGREINQLQYNESSTDEVEMIPCPECGKSFLR